MSVLTLQELGFAVRTQEIKGHDKYRRVHLVTIPTIRVREEPLVIAIAEGRLGTELSDLGVIYDRALAEYNITPESNDVEHFKEVAYSHGCHFVQRKTGIFYLVLNTSRKNLPEAFLTLIEAIKECFEVLESFAHRYDYASGKLAPHEEIDLSSLPFPGKKTDTIK